MENHPIPQNVSGFQFKLIGEMTLKQFAYFATGIIFGYIFLALPIFFLIKFPIAFCIASVGLGFAFLPVEGRPMDTMFFNYIKALFAPNQFIYQKVGGQLAPAYTSKSVVVKQIQPQQSPKKLQEYLNTISTKQSTKFDDKESLFLQSISTNFQNSNNLGPAIPVVPPPMTPPPIKNVQPILQTHPVIKQIQIDAPIQPAVQQMNPRIIPTYREKEVISEKSQEKSNIVLTDELAKLQSEINKTKSKEESQTQASNTQLLHQRTAELETQLNDMVRQKQLLEEQILTMTKKADYQNQSVFTPSVAQVKKETLNVRKISKAAAPKIGLLAPTDPNLITGIVKDPRENILPNILVEVKDKDGNPVRAFKTNALGQFASATPLVNGSYTVQFEDPQGKNKFDTIEIIVNGEIISPIEVISVDAREELRRDLFGV